MEYQMTNSKPSVRWTVGELLERQNMSTQELADKASIAYNTALALRRGIPEQINIDVLRRVCVALGVQPGDLLILDNSE